MGQTIPISQAAGVVQPEGDASPRRSGLVLSSVLVAVFIDLWLGGPLKALDVWLAHWTVAESTGLRGPLGVVDSIGLRGATLPVLMLVVFWLRRRTGRWRPLGVALVTVVVINVAIGSMKVLAGRGRPSMQSPDLFTGDVLWPSGHAANVVITSGLIVYLVRHYGQCPIGRRAGWLIVAVPSAAMTAVSVALGYHWLTDLVAGVIVGQLVVVGVTSWDARSAHDRCRNSYRRGLSADVVSSPTGHSEPTPGTSGEHRPAEKAA